MPPRRRNGNGNGENNREHTPPPPPERRIEELFLKQNPPTFDGRGDPSEAEEWIRALERIFKFLRCDDKERLLCMSFQLKGSADYWWETRQKIYTEEQLQNLTWEQFKESLNDKYIPRSYRKHKEAEFSNLKQGKKTVSEYDRVFCDLARFASNKVDTDEKMSELFCAGLRQDIRVVLASQRDLSYAEALNRALDMEMAMQPEKTIQAPTSLPPQSQNANTANQSFSDHSQSYQGKRKWDDKNQGNKKSWQGQGQQQFNQRNSKPQTMMQHGASTGPQGIPPCSNCHKMHKGNCKAGSNNCFTCGQTGHFSYQCPNKQRGGDGGRPGQAQTPNLRAMEGFHSQQQQRPRQPQHFQGQQSQQMGPSQQNQPQQQYQRVFALDQKPCDKEQGNLAGTSSNPRLGNN